MGRRPGPILTSEFEDARHVDQLADERALVRKVVNVVVLELVERRRLRLLVDDNGEHLACVELGGRVEVHLPKERAEAGDGSRVPLNLLVQVVDLYARSVALLQELLT